MDGERERELLRWGSEIGKEGRKTLKQRKSAFLETGQTKRHTHGTQDFKGVSVINYYCVNC